MIDSPIALTDEQKCDILFIGENRISHNLDPAIMFEPVNRIDIFTMIHHYHDWLVKNFNISVKK